jgi:hypothetical protein
LDQYFFIGKEGILNGSSKQYINMCEKAPKEITAMNWDDKGQIIWCEYHKKFVSSDCEGSYSCDGMEKVQSNFDDCLIPEYQAAHYNAPGLEKKRDRLWGKLQKSDEWCEDKHWIRLPRQDELQNIVFAEDLTNGDVGYPLFCIVKFENEGGHNSYSFEQLWLSFVMKEKYGKKWNGKEWK